MQDPRDDETLVKFLVNLKQRCIAAEIENRDLREALKALKAEFAPVSLAGNRNIKSNADLVHGKFAFKPRVASATNAESSASQRRANPDAGPYLETCKLHKTSGFIAASPESSESPALRHLLCTDHLVFASYSRQAILKDIQLLSRHLDSMGDDNSLLKVQQVRLEKQLSCQHRRANFPVSTSSSSRKLRNGANSGANADRSKSAPSSKNAEAQGSEVRCPATSTLPSSALARQGSATPGDPSSSSEPPVVPSDARVGTGEEANDRRRPSASLSSMAAEIPPALPCLQPVPAEPVVPYDVVIRTGSCRLWRPPAPSRRAPRRAPRRTSRSPPPKP
jgi:hypothetical protein